MRDDNNDKRVQDGVTDNKLACLSEFDAESRKICGTKHRDYVTE